MRIEQTWHIDPVTRGSVHRMAAHIGGEVFEVAEVQGLTMQYMADVKPLVYTERELRRKIMAAIEKRLFGRVN